MWGWLKAAFTFSLQTMNRVYGGRPFVNGPTNNSVNLGNMSFVNKGRPFVTYWKN